MLRETLSRVIELQATYHCLSEVSRCGFSYMHYIFCGDISSRSTIRKPLYYVGRWIASQNRYMWKVKDIHSKWLVFPMGQNAEVLLNFSYPTHFAGTFETLCSYISFIDFCNSFTLWLKLRCLKWQDHFIPGANSFLFAHGCYEAVPSSNGDLFGPFSLLLRSLLLLLGWLCNFFI